MTKSETLSGGIKRGHGSTERPLMGEIWRKDSQSNHQALQAKGEFEPSNQQVNYKRYYDPDWFNDELEKLFSKTWLFAAREEDIPQIGDRVPFEVGPLSFLIARSGEDEFKAFYNACLHRGTTLCDKAESGPIIRCPYHGWEWHVDGKLKRIPSHWDFTGINRINGSLREVRLERWAGFIFINADVDAPPLEEALKILPDHFKEFAPESRYTAARFRKHVKANWKIAQEAFMESYHLTTTHPEAVDISGDTQTQYDLWVSEKSAVGRNASPGGLPSMHADADATVAQAAAMFAAALRDWHYPDIDLPSINPDKDPRMQVAQWHRDAIERTYGLKSPLPDSMMLDSLLYFMFPHCGFWLCESLPFTYQFTPHPTNPGESYFEVRMLLPCPKDGERPASSPVIEIAQDESVLEKAPDFGFLGYVFDQDMSNMPLVQKGVRNADPRMHHTYLGQYQEIIIQHWNALIDQYLAK